MKDKDFLTWAYWIAATATAAVTMSAYAFSNFALKSDVKDYLAAIEKRLESIEGKVDRLQSK